MLISFSVAQREIRLDCLGEFFFHRLLQFGDHRLDVFPPKASVICQASHLFTHMARIDILAILTVLRPMPVVGKTWALAWVRIVARALPRRREHRMPHRYSGGRRRWPLLGWRLRSSIE